MVERIRAEIEKITTGQTGGRHRSQREIDAYRRQLILLGISVAGILLVVILAAGAAYQYLYLPNQTVASAGDRDITREDYWTYRKYELLTQINQYQQMSQMMQGEQQQQYQQLAVQALQEFNDIEDADIDPVTVDEMIDNVVIMESLDDFGIEITDDEVDEYLVQFFTGRQLSSVQDNTPPRDPTAEAWAAATAEARQQEAEEAQQEADEAEANGDTDFESPDDEAESTDGDTDNGDAESAEPEATPTPQPTPSDEDLRATATVTQGQHQTNLLDEADISHDDFVDLVVKPEIGRERIRQALAQDIAVRAEQVHAAHILLATEEAAQLVYEDLVSDEELDFAAAAEQQSTDSQTAPNGGDLGWFPRGVMVSEFDEVVFDLEPGEISEPFQTEFGWHIVTVHEREEDRPVPVNTLSQLRQQAFNDWLAERRAELDIDSGDLELPVDDQAPVNQFQPPPSAPQPPQQEIPQQPIQPQQPQQSDPFQQGESVDPFDGANPFEDASGGDEDDDSDQ